MDARINGYITIEPIGDAMELAEKLVTLRAGAGLTQESLGKALGVSRQAVSKWERGESMPDVANLVALSKLYNTTVDEILGGAPKDRVCDKEEGFSMHFGARLLTDEEMAAPVPEDTHVVSHPTAKVVMLFVLVVTAVILQSLFAENAWFILVPAGMTLITFALNIYDRRKGDTPAGPKAIAGLLPMCWVLISAFMALGLVGGVWHPSWLMLLLEIPWITIMRFKSAELTSERA